MDIPGLAEEPFPVRSREASGSVKGIPTEVTILDFADKILLTISQEGSLSQWVCYTSGFSFTPFSQVF
jgi:proteasome assembly chaperone 3